MKQRLLAVASWFSKERLEYLSHAATISALLVTVAFSWLSWQEARQARIDQANLFIAEKAPRLEVTRSYLESQLMLVEVRNIGESTLRGLRYVAMIQTPLSLTEMRHVTRKEEVLFEGKVTLLKGEALAIPFETTTELQKLIGYAPASVEVQKDMLGTSRKPDEAFIAVWFTFFDVLGNSYPHGSTLVLSRKN